MRAQVARFIDHLAIERALSEHTCRAYRRDLLQLVEHLEERGLSFDGLAPRDLRGFLAARHARAAASTRNSKPCNFRAASSVSNCFPSASRVATSTAAAASRARSSHLTASALAFRRRACCAVNARAVSCAAPRFTLSSWSAADAAACVDRRRSSTS